MFATLARRARALGLAGTAIDIGETIGNRFLLVWRSRSNDCDTWLEQAFWSDFARAVCNHGPRVDDTLHVALGDNHQQFEFWVVGGDGRVATHCANGLLYAGLRCHQATDAGHRALFHCGGEVRTVDILGSVGVRVKLGVPRILRRRWALPASLLRAPYSVYTGEPHAVSFYDDLAIAEPPYHDRFIEIGSEVCSGYGPAGINWNLVDVVANDELRIRTFERGVRRMTSACGTGSAASFYATLKSGRITSHEALVYAHGGSHLVALHNDHLLVTGRPFHHKTERLDNFLLCQSEAVCV
jgi:diaminopimelate epimerase